MGGGLLTFFLVYFKKKTKRQMIPWQWLESLTQRFIMLQKNSRQWFLSLDPLYSSSYIRGSSFFLFSECNFWVSSRFSSA